MLVSLAPTRVFAQTGDFTLEVAGDKFTPATYIHWGGNEVPTRFVNPQRLAATIPAALVASPGTREVIVRSRYGQLYSNTTTFEIAAPPAPPYMYVGIIGELRYNDTALLKDQNSGDILNARRGDIIGGRFRVMSISERAIEFTDTELRVKHTLPMVEGRPGENRGLQSLAPPSPSAQAPPPKPAPAAGEEEEDDEPR